MKPFGFFTCIATPSDNRELAVPLFQLNINMRALGGWGNDRIMSQLFIHPANKEREDYVRLFQNLPGVLKVFVVPISNPVTKEELHDVRKIFAEMDWDASKVDDEKLSAYIDSIFKGQYTYYLDIGFRKRGRDLIPMDIKKLEEHPEFSPDWVMESSDESDWMTRDISFDEMEIKEVEVVLSKTVIPPPPPPEPPHNLSEMSDEEIRLWLSKHENRINEDVELEVERTPEEIRINMYFESGTEGIIYKLKN